MVLGAADDIRDPAPHPYCQALLRSFPPQQVTRRELAGIPGSPPDLRDAPPGCPFIPRCAHAVPACAEVDMTLAPVVGSRGPEHVTACPIVTPEMAKLRVPTEGVPS